MQHDHGFGAFAKVVVVQLQVQFAFADAGKTAAVGFVERGTVHEVCSPFIK
ncbi:hypothetical protein D3C81_2201700 [compost metagenome]